MKALDFTLLDSKNREITLSNFKGQKIILYFYPKDNTPGCTQEACAFRDSYERLLEKNCIIIGISPDSPKSHSNFETKHTLPFILLSDPDKEVAKLYDVYKLKKLYGKEYMGVERSTFIISEEFEIIKTYQKVKINGHIDDILTFLR